MEIRELLTNVLTTDDLNIKDFENIILRCLNSNRGDEELHYLAQLASKSYSKEYYGITLNFCAIIAIMSWGKCGLDVLLEIANKSQKNNITAAVIRVISYSAGASLEYLADYYFDKYFSSTFETKLKEVIYKDLMTTEYIQLSKSYLIRFIADYKPSELIPIELIHSFQLIAQHYAFQNNSVLQNFIFALSGRWFGLNTELLDNYQKLINTDNVSEEIIHKFLNKHPYLIDPFYSKYWSKPKLGEKLIADFIFKGMDNTYTIVEIEKPSDPIINKDGNLNSKATHAVKQVLEYRDWVISNHLYAKEAFDNIWIPTCLVIIGMESSLSEMQISRLKQENESRQGKVKVVGFDWLYNRSLKIFHNVINGTFERYEVKNYKGDSLV